MLQFYYSLENITVSLFPWVVTRWNYTQHKCTLHSKGCYVNWRNPNIFRGNSSNIPEGNHLHLL